MFQFKTLKKPQKNKTKSILTKTLKIRKNIVKAKCIVFVL